MQIEQRIDQVVMLGCDTVRLLHPIASGTYGSVYKGQLMKQGSSQSAAAADASKGENSSSSSGGGSSSSSVGQYVAVKVFPACVQPPAITGCECGSCLSFTRERNALLLLQRKVGAVQLLAAGAVKLLDPAAAAANPGNSMDDCISSSSAQQQEQLVRRPCLVMELADGTLEGNMRHSEQEACELIVPLMSALTIMHSGSLGHDRSYKVVHRDLKPANILVTAAGPVICDFSNCAIWHGPALRCRMMDTIAGTPLYMPVEMRDPDEKGYSCNVDGYSMGLVALSLLLGGSAALDQRASSHCFGTVESWLMDFVNTKEVPHEQRVTLCAAAVCCGSGRCSCCSMSGCMRRAMLQMHHSLGLLRTEKHAAWQ
jgi:serine/threonine protein kinase